MPAFDGQFQTQTKKLLINARTDIAKSLGHPRHVYVNVSDLIASLGVHWIVESETEKKSVKKLISAVSHWFNRQNKRWVSKVSQHLDILASQ